MSIGTELERYMLGLINQARAVAGLNALTLEQNLNDAAEAHSQWMIVHSELTHTGENNSNGIGRMAAAGFDRGTNWQWGENIGAQRLGNGIGFYDEIDIIVGRWLDSPFHTANILNPNYDVVGLGISLGTLPTALSNGFTGLIATQNFARSNGVYDLDMTGSVAPDTLRGQAGDDHIVAAAGNDLILGNAGADSLFAGIGNDSVNAGASDDAVVGDAGNDFLRGAGGNDTIRGDAGHDVLLGDAGADVLRGGAGNDSLTGGDGNDVIAGDAGFDALQGGNGNDTMVGGAQADNLFASAGDDLLRGDAGFDRLFGGFGNDRLYGGDGPDALFGNGGADRMYGEDGNDRSYGAGGNDFIQDGAGNDLIEAGAGFDTLDGGAGNDRLMGRFNADRFVFVDAPRGFGNDTIGDFAATNDFERVDLTGVAQITDMTDLLANHVTQTDNGVLIEAGSNSSILLEDVALSDLDVNDFLI